MRSDISEFIIPFNKNPSTTKKEDSLSYPLCYITYSFVVKPTVYVFIISQKPWFYCSFGRFIYSMNHCRDGFGHSIIVNSRLLHIHIKQDAVLVLWNTLTIIYLTQNIPLFQLHQTFNLRVVIAIWTNEILDHTIYKTYQFICISIIFQWALASYCNQ